MVTRTMERSQSTSFQQVEDWLRGLGLLQYAQSFYDNGYEEIDTCKEITQEDLDVIGVKSERDRDDIITAVERLKQNLYFELEAPIIEKPEPVKFDPLVLKSKLKEELAKRNTQLIEPPYYFPVSFVYFNGSSCFKDRHLRPSTGKNVKNPGLGTGRFRGGFSSKNF